MVKATAKVSTAATVTLKHLAAKLAEDHGTDWGAVQESQDGRLQGNDRSAGSSD